MYVYDADANSRNPETAKRIFHLESTRLGMYLYLSIHVCMYVCIYMSMYFCFFHPLRTYLFYIYTCIVLCRIYVLTNLKDKNVFSETYIAAKPVLINKHSKLLLQLLLDDIQLWKSLRNDKKDYIKPHHEKMQKTTAPSSPVQDKEDSVDH